jgi:hypothetical protein
VWHRIASIDGEIEHSQLQLVAINQRWRQSGRYIDSSLDKRPDRPREQLIHASDQSTKVDRLGIEFLFARKCEQPLGQ